MAIRPRVKPSGQAPSPEAAVDAVIARGGASAAAAKPEPAPAPAAERKFTLRISDDLARQIEADAASRPGKVSVNTWLIEAAVEHLHRRNSPE